MTSQIMENRLQSLVDLFYDSPETLGIFTEAANDQVPESYARLLVHKEHMTVAMEAFHESLVDVEVLETRIDEDHYSRKILLHRQSDGQTVQYGIVRIHLARLAPEVRAEIEQQHRPLGRILVRHNLLRTIHLDQLWRVMPGEELCRLFKLKEPRVTYGRTARIDLDGEPAIELLEIVTPLS